MCFLGEVLTQNENVFAQKTGNWDHLSLLKHLYLAFEHKAYEIVIYRINERNLEDIARVTDNNFSLERNRAITSYVVDVNSHVSVYMHFCVPS